MQNYKEIESENRVTKLFGEELKIHVENFVKSSYQIEDENLLKFIMEFHKSKYDEILIAFNKELYLKILTQKISVKGLENLLIENEEKGRQKIKNLIENEFEICNLFLRILKSEILKHRGDTDKKTLWYFIEKQNQSKLNGIDREIESLLFKKYQYQRRGIKRPSKIELIFLLNFALNELRLDKKITKSDILRIINENFDTKWTWQSFQRWGGRKYHNFNWDMILNKRIVI